MKLNQEIRFIKGVGPKKAQLFNRIGIARAVDMLFFLPRGYEDRSNLISIKAVEEGAAALLRVKVLRAGLQRRSRARSVFQIMGTDGTGVAQCLWFNQPFLRDVFKTGETYILFGRAERQEAGTIQMIHPEYEPADRGVSVHFGRIVPIYPLTQDLTQKYVRRIFHQVIREETNLLKDMFSAEQREKFGIIDINTAVRNIHFPESFDSLEDARRRIFFSEFFLLQLALGMRKTAGRQNSRGISQMTDEAFVKAFESFLPFELTSSQRRVIEEIRADMAGTSPMNRLLEGDVGSGKTVIAAFALLSSLHNGNQAVFMAPTEILAQQQYMKLSEFFLPYDIKLALLISAIKPQEKAEIKKRLSEGAVDIAVGTHALIQEDVNFKKLGLAVIDEQHKFGVRQRELLRKKGQSPDVLIMSATPIPRTLALTVYGELDISTLEGVPAGRGLTRTYLFDAEQREAVYRFAREKVKGGTQAYVICPFIEEVSGEKYAQAAESVYRELKDSFFADIAIGLLHGKMDAREKDTAFTAFRKAEIKVLVSTSIIEVGMDVPNAACMIIENAERFGLAQLHQMRGRIGRGEEDAYCLLISAAREEESRRRLQIMVDYQDGFRIAQTDLELRGSGQIFGSRQHGLADLRFGDPAADLAIMNQAKEAAGMILRDDPRLEGEKYRLIRKSLEMRFQKKLELAQTG